MFLIGLKRRPITGALSVALHVGAEGHPAQPAAGGPDQAVRQPEERGERHQEPPLVQSDGLDFRLPEEGWFFQ